jgi:PAS domain S-box-containing protein
LANAAPTPLLGILLLTALSFRLGPQSLAGLAFIYFFAVAYTLELSWTDPLAQLRETPNRWLRLASFVVGCAALVLLSRSRQQVSRAGEAFRSLLARLPVAIIVSDRDGIITLANDKAARLFGMSRDDLVGYSYFSILTHPEARSQQIQRYLDRFQSDRPDETEETVHIRLPDGRTLHGTEVVATNLDQRLMITAVGE